MRRIDSQYKDLYRFIMQQGLAKASRTDIGTTSALGGWMRFDLRDDILPITSLRLVRPEKFIGEQLWFVSGNPSIKFLKDNNISIWDSWFIPGTAVYEDQIGNVNKPLDIRGRIALANDMGLGEDLFEFADQVMDRERVEETYAETNVQLCPEFTGPWDLFKSELDQIVEWLDQKGVLAHEPVAAKPVSLQTRLNRIDKGQHGQWTAINEIVFAPTVSEAAEKSAPAAPATDVFGEAVVEKVIPAAVEKEAVDVEIEVYHQGKFQKLLITESMADKVWEAMDEMKIPAYRLVDANIGQGGYGPQWRNWQDTQIIDCEDLDKFKAQGYEYVTEVDDLDFGHPFYGKVIVHRNIDQLANMVDALKNDPDNRRIIVSAWNPGRTWQAALPPCHLYYQCVSYEKDLRDYEEDFAKLDITGEYLETLTSIHEGGELDPEDTQIEEKFCAAAKAFAIEKGLPTRWVSMGVVLRSWDTPAGGVFNTPQYAVLLRMIAHVTNMDARELFIVGIDAHIYDNQKEAIDDVIYTDSPDDCPRLKILRKVESIDDFNISDFEVTGYNPVPNTKVMPIAR